MRIRSVLLSTTVCGVLAHFTAGAQEAPQSAEPTRGETAQRAGGIDEIIVTARKRQESVLDVPVVETVLTAQLLEQAQITDLRGVTSRVPGLVLGNSVGTVGTQISLRGIGTSSLDAGIDQSVSLNIDGQQFSQGLAFRSGLFDLAQAEVLRGPQALFFGKNSPGGVIALTTADPGSEAEIIARQSYEFEADESRTELILSGPITDELGVRLAGSYSDAKGFFHNTATALPGTGALQLDDRFGELKSYIVRGTVVWQPTDSFRARFKVNATKDKGDAMELQNVSCPSGTGPSPIVGLQFIGGPKRCVQDRNYEIVGMDPAVFGGVNADGSPGLRYGGRPFNILRQHFEVLDLTYSTDNGIIVTSTSTYYDNKTDVGFNGVMGGEAGPTLFADNTFARHDFTEEVRVQSDRPGAPLNWMLGGFLQEAGMRNRIFLGGNTAVGLPQTLGAGTHNLDISSWSLFGQLRWRPIEVLEIAGGVRYTDEERENNAITRNPLTGAFETVDLPTPKISAKNWSPELTVTYTPTDDLTVFGALKQGYKSGSFSITTPADSVTDKSFGDERVRGGEIGVKSRLLDRTLNVNAAVYYYKYKGLQVGVSQPTGPGNAPVTQTLNAGNSKIYGVDFDAQYQFPVPGLQANLSVNWNKAKFLSLHGVPCYGGQTIALGCDEQFTPGYTLNAGGGVLIPSPRFVAQDASGEVLERAPKWQLNGGLDYEFNVSNGLALALGASAQYSSKYRAALGPRDDFFQKSYTRYNGYLTLKDANDAWELSLIGNNLSNKLRAGYCGVSDFQNSTIFTGFAQTFGQETNPTGKIDDVACAVDPGRQIFLKLTVRPLSWMK
jgi:iron complex outermembrane receptor protein